VTGYCHAEALGQHLFSFNARLFFADAQVLESTVSFIKDFASRHQIRLS
jgi:hypothetical protein